MCSSDLGTGPEVSCIGQARTGTLEFTTGLTVSVKPDCWLACSNCFWRGIPAPGMNPENNNEGEIKQFCRPYTDMYLHFSCDSLHETALVK